MPQVELERVSMSYPGPNGRARALSDVSLAVERGEFLVLAGPSGSGKTTLLRLVAGLEEPVGGIIRIHGQPVGSIPPRERPVAMVFQTAALFPEMTVWDNLAFGLEVRGVARAEIRSRVNEAAEALGLGECLRRKPEAISGGERQRVALGRALVRRPSVLLLDEPLTSLDPTLRAQLRRLIRDLHARIGCATIYVTHDHSEAMLLADRLAVLRAGGLEQVGSPSTVYRCPASLFVAGFLGSRPINLFAGALRVSSGLLRFQERSGAFELVFPAPAAFDRAAKVPPAVVLGVRPEDVLLANAQPGPASPRMASTPGIIESVEDTGAELFVTVRCGEVACLVRSPSVENLRKDSPATLQFDPGRFRFFDADTGKSFLASS